MDYKKRLVKQSRISMTRIMIIKIRIKAGGKGWWVGWKIYKSDEYRQPTRINLVVAQARKQTTSDKHQPLPATANSMRPTCQMPVCSRKKNRFVTKRYDTLVPRLFRGPATSCRSTPSIALRELQPHDMQIDHGLIV
jgi:hypothetical protein